MSVSVDLYHPRHVASPIRFSATDKAVLIASQPRPVLLAESSISVDSRTASARQTIHSATALDTTLSRDKAQPLSAHAILGLFDSTHIALQESGKSHSLNALAQLLKAGKVMAYHWPYSLPKIQRKGGRKTRSSVPNSQYVAPFVPSLSELDRLVSKAERLRGANKEQLGRALLEEAVPYAPPEVAKGVGLLKQAESLKDADPETLARTLAPQILPHASPEAQAAFSQVNGVVGPLNDAHTAYQSGDKLGAAMALSHSGLPSLPISDTCVGGEPISLFSGEELLQLDDVSVAGPVPFKWTRTYRSSNPHDSGLGVGWTHSLCDTLVVNSSKSTLILHDTEGRLIVFPLPDIGERSHNSPEALSVYRPDDDHFVLSSLGQTGGVRRHYHAVAAADENHYYLTRVEDSHHNGYQLHYASGRLAYLDRGQETDRIDFRYSDCGHIAALLRADNHDPQAQKELVKYTYNDQHDLICATDAEGFCEQYRYQHHLIRERQIKSGYRFYFEWDTTGPDARCLRQWGDEIQGQATYDYHFQWDVAQHQVVMTDTRGGQHLYRFNEQAHLIYHQDPEAGETHITRNEQQQITLITYPDDSVEQSIFNDDGLCTAYSNRRGQTTYFAHDGQGRVIASVDHEGKRWSRDYNDHNQVTSITNPLGHTTQYRYNRLGLISSVINPLGHSTTYLWNEQGQLSAVRDPEGRSQHYHYNEQQQLTAIHHAANQVTRYQYNCRGQVSALTTPDKQTTRYTYTPLGLLDTVTDAAGRITQYTYDGLSQVTKRVLNKGTPFESTLSYEYDGERNLIGLYNEKGERYQLAYDLNERLIKEIGFDGNITESVYNTQGHVIQKIERHNDTHTEPTVTHYERDSRGQITTQTTADGSTHFAYHESGQLSEARNAHRHLKWSYNLLDQMTEEWQDDHVIRHHYDKAGNLDFTQLPTGDILQRRYNGSQQLTELTHIAKHNKQRNTLLSLKYNKQGREKQRHHGNGLSTLSHYDPQGRLSHCGVVQRKPGSDPTKELISNMMGGSHDHYFQRNLKQYHYSAANQLVKIDDQFKGVSIYHYDPLDRLIQVDGPVPEHILHDPANNVLAISQSKTEAEQQAAHAKTKHNRLQQQGTTQYEFDSYGNRVLAQDTDDSKTTTQYQYNAQHQLTAVKNEHGLTLFDYDALGRRVGKQYKDKQGVFTRTTYLWQGDNLLQETKKVKSQIATDSTTQTYLFEPNSHKPLALIKDHHVYRYHLDHLGTPEALSNESGKVVWYTSLTSYGNLAIDFKDNIPEENRADIAQPFRFQGQQYDPETGLHYNRHRYYDPQTGSFITSDPIKLAGGVNHYLYTPNPISWVDPLGLSCKEAALSLTAAAAITAGGVGYKEPSFFDALVDPEYWSIVGDSLTSKGNYSGWKSAGQAVGNMAKIGAGSVTMVGGFALSKFNPTVGGYMMADGASIYSGGVGDLANQYYGTNYDADFMKHAYRNASEFYGGTPEQGDMARAGIGVTSVLGAWRTPVTAVVNPPKNGWTGTTLTYEKTVPAITAASAVELANDGITAKDAFKTMANSVENEDVPNGN